MLSVPISVRRESGRVTESHDSFRGLTLDALREAVAIYLRHAYPDGRLPEAVQRRLHWAVERGIPGLLTVPPFETIPPAGDDRRAPIYALRLGNQRYPHMKLQIQSWRTRVGYLLTVNTHDQVERLDPGTPGAAEFQALQVYNREVKEAIERDWDAHGFPNFHRYLTDYLSQVQD
ncbi:MAG: hypothetical protein KatS3mg108_3699 [Isosphaeraceae bacterium]|nr:MAG: hypothetical protein KatS3mg108_3699 [Isosphaeraceae bacterium]